MVNYKDINLIYDDISFKHINKHNVGINEVLNALSYETYSRKLNYYGVPRLDILGMAFGRILRIILELVDSKTYKLITAFEPDDNIKKLFRKKRKM